MSISIFTSSSQFSKLVHNQEHEVYGMFSFHPPKMSNVERPKLNIAVAMDLSSSMHGSKIEAAKQSLLKLVEHMTAEDRLCVVTFDSAVETLFKPTIMNETGKAEAQRLVSGLQPRGCTNLSGGLLKALELLRESDAPKSCVRQCLLFTDGQANQGITDSKEIVRIASEFREKIGISTFGYGQGHDADLLEGLAQDGGFYFIDSPDKILAAFGRELGGLVSTFAQNVELQLQPAKGVEIVEVLTDLTVIEDGEKITIQCDDLLAEQVSHVVLRLKVESKKTHPRGIRIVAGKLKYFDLEQTKLCEQTTDLKIQFVRDANGDENIDVMDQVAVQLALAAQRKAIFLADQGDFAGSRAAIMFCSQQLGDINSSNSADLQNVHTNMAAGVFTSESYVQGSSEVKSFTKGLTRGRVSGPAYGVNLSDAYSNSSQQDMEKAFEVDVVSGDAPKFSRTSDNVDGIVLTSGGTTSTGGNILLRNGPISAGSVVILDPNYIDPSKMIPNGDLRIKGDQDSSESKKDSGSVSKSRSDRW